MRHCPKSGVHPCPILVRRVRIRGIMYRETFSCDQCGCSRDRQIRADWFILTTPPPKLSANFNKADCDAARSHEPTKHLCSVRCAFHFLAALFVKTLPRRLFV